METINKYHSELISFHYVAENKSFTLGAQELGLSKSQVSKHVRQIEGILNAQLINRTTRTFNLTEEGQTLFEYTKGLVKLTNSASIKIRGLVEEDHGVLRFSAPPSFDLLLTKRASQGFKKEFPNAHLSLDYTREVKDFSKGEVDIAVRIRNVTDPDLIAKYMGNSDEIYVASSKFFNTHKKPIVPSDLVDLPCIYNNYIKNSQHWYLKKGRKEELVKVQGGFSCSTFEGLRDLALAGLGIAKIPKILIKEDLRKGTLIEVLKEYKSYGNEIYLVYPKQTYMNKKQKFFKEFLVNWFAENMDSITKLR